MAVLTQEQEQEIRRIMKEELEAQRNEILKNLLDQYIELKKSIR